MGIQATAMRAFTQNYYNNGLKTQETKIAATSDNETIIIVANEDGTAFEVNQKAVFGGRKGAGGCPSVSLFSPSSYSLLSFLAFPPFHLSIKGVGGGFSVVGM